ncbi:hypothetical protein D3C72_2192990 [compost metagenome]
MLKSSSRIWVQPAMLPRLASMALRQPRAMLQPTMFCMAGRAWGQSPSGCASMATSMACTTRSVLMVQRIHIWWMASPALRLRSPESTRS